MKVRAIAFGEYLGKRKIGDVFEFEGKPSDKWMEPVDDAAREAFEKAGIKVAGPFSASAPKDAPAAYAPDLTKAEQRKADKAAAKEAEKEARAASTGDQNVI